MIQNNLIFTEVQFLTLSLPNIFTYINYIITKREEGMVTRIHVDNLTYMFLCMHARTCVHEVAQKDLLLLMKERT